MVLDDNMPLRTKCVASTGLVGLKPEDYTASHDKSRRNFFSHLQFSGDGTTILAQTADHSVRTVILQTDLLDEVKQPHRLNEYLVNRSPSPIQSFSIYPNFNLQDASTSVFLSASTDLPISLKNAVHFETTHAAYPWINPKTEAYIVPKSLCWTRNGESFIAGANNEIGLFNAHHYGAGPFSSQRSGKDAKQRSANGCKGFVTALSVSDDGVLAAGTNERQIGLYDGEGGGQCITAFSVADVTNRGDDFIKGTGIMQMSWTPCGTYLLAAERQSDGIHVYDMRNTLRRVNYLHGRKVYTNQRMDINLIPTADGTELWAGGTDGCVRMWKNPGATEGYHSPDAEMQLHGDSVGGVAWHPQGSVLATCAGSYHFPSVSRDADDSDSDADVVESPGEESCLKVWGVNRG